MNEMDRNEVDPKRAWASVFVWMRVCVCTAYAYVTYTERTAQHVHSFDSVYSYVLLSVVGLASLRSTIPSSALAHVLSLSLPFFLSFGSEYSFSCCWCCVNMCFSIRLCMRERYALCIIIKCSAAKALFESYHSEKRGKKWAKEWARVLFLSVYASVCVFCLNTCVRACKRVYVCVLLKIHLARLTLIASQMRIHTNFFSHTVVL